MKFKNFVLATLLLTVSCFSMAQITLNGKVVDQLTSEALAGATVQIKGSQTGAVTDENGNFSLTSENKEGMLVVRFSGHEERLVSFNDVITNPIITLTSKDLEEIRIVGFETDRSLLRSTGSIAVADERDFERADKSSLSQMINQIPGVQSRGPSVLRPATISIRGMGARGPGQTGRIKLYLNDLMLTNADGTNAWEDIDPYTIGSIEVIKGPASSIYGANVGGVVNISTQQSSYNENSIEGFGMGGSFDTYRVGTTYKYGNDQSRLMATIGTQATDGFREHSEEQRDFLTFFGTIKPHENHKTSIFFNRNRYASRSAGALTPNQVEEDPTQALPMSVLNNAGRDRRFTRIGVSNEWKINDNWRNISSFTASATSLDHPIQFLYIYQWGQDFGGRTRFVHENKLFGKRLYWTIGGEYLQGVVKTSFYGINEGLPNGTVIGDREAEIKNGIVFTQVEVDITDDLLVTGGVSANFYQFNNLELTLEEGRRQQRNFDPFFAPRVAFNYSPLKNIAFHGNVSTGFTPPAVGDINLPDGSVNLDLRPETALNFEIGTRGKLAGNYLVFDASIYRINLVDEILTRTPEIGFSIRENAGKTSYTGAELALRGDLIQQKDKFFKVISPSLGYTYQETVFVDFVESFTVQGNIVTNDLNGRMVPGNAPHRVFSNVHVETKHGLYAFVNLEWVDATPINNMNTLFNDSFRFLGAKVGWRGNIGKRFEANVYAGGNNLLDEIYSDSPALNPNPIAFGPLAGQFAYMNINWGRNFYAGVNLKFLFNR